MNRLRELGSGIWTLRGDPIRFFGFPYELRSTIVELDGDALLVHSPIQLAAARGEVESLGRVAHLVTPNKLHHLFLGEWIETFPDAKLYAPPGLRSRRPDLRFDTDLTDEPDPAWAGILDQQIVKGSFFMEEVVFFHRESRTLILGDLVENHDPGRLGPVQRLIARANAMLAPDGSTPRNYRWSFWRRAAARRTLEEVLAWQPRRLVVAHGPCVESGASEFLERALRWLL